MTMTKRTELRPAGPLVPGHIACPECGAQAKSRKSLGTHRSKAHGVRARRVYSWNQPTSDEQEARTHG